MGRTETIGFQLLETHTPRASDYRLESIRDGHFQMGVAVPSGFIKGRSRFLCFPQNNPGSWLVSMNDGEQRIRAEHGLHQKLREVLGYA